MATLNVEQTHSNAMHKITVEVDSETFNRLQNLTEIYGGTLGARTADALRDWTETVGTARLEIAAERLAADAQA